MTELYEHLENYLKSLAVQNYSVRTLKALKVDLSVFIRWLEEKNINDFSRITYRLLFKYQEHLSKVKSDFTKQNLSIGTQSRKLIYIRSFFKFLVKSGVLLNNPASKIELPRKPESIRWALLSVNDIKKLILINDINDPLGCRNRAIIEMFYSTAIRATELVNLKTDDIRFNENLIVINSGKGNKDRVLPVSNAALEWTKKYIENFRIPINAENAGKYAFLTNQGRKLRILALQIMVNGLAEKCGLKKKITPQCLRIASATHLLKNGADIRYVQEFLGHTTINSTMRYLHFDKSELKRAHTLSHPRERERSAVNV